MYTVFDASFYRVQADVQTLAPLLTAQGIQGINVPVQILEDRRQAEEAAAVVRDHGLRWGLLPTPVDLLAPGTSDELFAAGLERLERWAGVGSGIGVTWSYSHVIPGSDSRPFAENFDWHVGRVEQIAEVLNRHGIRYSLEFIGPRPLRKSFRHPFVDSISGVLAIADAVDREIGFLFDTYHWFCAGGRLDDLYYAAHNVSRMSCLHLNDGIAGVPVEEQQDLVRALPMTTGVIDSLTPYRLFRSHGFDGPVLCEPMSPLYELFEELPPSEVVAIIGRAFAQMDRLAAERPA